VHKLGDTRSSLQRDHWLLTPDTFVRTVLPGMKSGAAIVHIGTALGAAFAEYTAELEKGGELGNTTGQRFVFVNDGVVTVEIDGKRNALGARGYAYLPCATEHRVTASEASRVIVIEKPYLTIDGVTAPRAIISNEDSVSSHPLDDDPNLQEKSLLPDDVGFDFAVNTMVYQPGAALSRVEMHVMEHGLVMLEGGGIYRLGDRWYPVTAGDFIWMAPWCPQWFGAIGKTPAKYLIYKDWNRHPLGTPRK
jgi:(S)-ureidoglycine aminohydrolase